MVVELEEIKGLKVVPNNYESGTVCKVQSISEDSFAVELLSIKPDELNDYKENESVEFFGLHKHGIIYFSSVIIKKDDKNLLVNKPREIKEIQRRKYSRVPYDGSLEIKDYQDFKIKPIDISAGGLRFASNNSFVVGNEYDIKIELLNNLVIECTMQPIRVEEAEDEESLPYFISAKFKKIRSIDRIALMQYSLRLISEFQNKT